jgi:cyclic-di-GMP phosphodiesterase TipF (flagellum assembly factor)
MIRTVSALSIATHVLLVAAYGLLALAAGTGTALLMPGAQLLPVTTGLAIFFAACVAHLAIVLLGFQRATTSELDVLRDAYGAVRSELSQARSEARAILTAVESTTQSRQGQAMEIGQVMAEVKVLQSLVERVSTTQRVPAERERSLRLAAVGGNAVVPSPIEARDGGQPGSPSDAEILEHVREGLRMNRIDLYVQPVVSLPQRKRRHLECFSRIRTLDGGILLPHQYIDVAAREGLIGAIDNMLLFRSVQLARRLQKAQSRLFSIFVNISEHTLADAGFFRDFASFMADNRDLAPTLAFEFMQSHVLRLGGTVMLELERLARLGFRFSMDQVSDLHIDADELGRRHFRTVKIEAARLLDQVRQGFDVRGLKAALDRNGIDLIVDKIESEATLVEVLDHPVDFGQGYLFGEPRPMRE